MVFGGQLLAQSVMAGLAGQEGKSVKTIHTVFARGASPEAPLDVAVDRMHSGRSVASSTVTISQGDRLCTRSLVLLSAAEDDVIRHADRPSLPSRPEDDDGAVRRAGAWEICVVGGVDLNDPEQVGPPELDVWVRFAGAPEEAGTDQALVAYSTDGFLIGTAMRPHAAWARRRPTGPSRRACSATPSRSTNRSRHPSGTSSPTGAPMPGTAAATGRATSSGPTASWRRPSSRTR